MAVLLIAVLAFFQAAGPAEELESLVSKGQQMLSERRFEEALQHFSTLKETAAKDSRLYFFAGLALAGLGQADEAMAEIRRAIELDPGQLEYSLGLANIQAGQGDGPGALETLQAFAGPQIEQLEARELWLLADLYYRLQQFSEARRCLDRYLEVSPPDPRFYFLYAEVCLKSGEFRTAADYFQRVVDSSEEKGAGYYGLGMALAAQQRFEESGDAFQKALEFSPGNPEYRCELATVHLALERPGQALETLAPIAPQADRYPRVHFLLAESYKRMGDSSKAQHHLSRYQSARERRGGPSRGAGVEDQLTEADRLLSGNRVDDARRRYLQVLDLDANNWRAHFRLAGIYLSSGMFNDAFQHLARMEEIDPQAFELKYLMASYWLETGNLPRALSYAEQARDLRPDEPDSHNLLGNIYFSMGEMEKALTEYKAALDLAPDRQDIRLNYEAAARRQQ